MDNTMIERIWRTLKYSFVYLHAFDNGHEIRRRLADLINSTTPENRIILLMKEHLMKLTTN
jgi:hypothetical protein